MRIEILDEAERDLIEGFRFYESQSAGLGEYFLNSVFSDIDSLNLYAGVHSHHFGYLQRGFPSPSITRSMARGRGSTLSWIVEEIQNEPRSA